MESPSHEIELKFGVPAERLDALKRALARGTVGSERLLAEYFDTEGESLAAAAISLRLRREGGRWVQTAKVSTEDPARRVEDNAALPAGRRVAMPALDLSRHADSPAGKALHEALAGAEPATLVRRFTVEVRRSTRTLRHQGARIELALDQGRIVASGAEEAVCELELELKTGSEAALYALADRWLAAHGLWLAAESKAERGTRLARGEPVAAALRARAPQLGGVDAPAELARRVFRTCLGQIVANAGALASGNGSDEHIHQLRVGVRRLRSALRELGALVAGVDPAWEAALREAFGELGAHRDQAIVLPRWADEIAAAGAPPVAPAGAAPEVRAPRTIVREVPFQRALLGLTAFCSGPLLPADGAGGDGGDPRRLLADRLERLHRRIARDAKKFATLSGDDQHRVRKRLKRLRYLSEFAAPLFGRKAVKRYLDAMGDAQDALGTLNDERIAEAAYRAQAAGQPEAWFGAGWLAGRQPASIETCARALQRVGRAARFWSRRLG